MIPEILKSPVTIARLAAGFLLDGVPGLQAEADQLADEELAMLQDRGHKLGKVEAWYTPLAPLPFFYLYDCSHCRFWQGPNRCQIVGLPDDPWGGEAIHPFHFCVRWLPLANEPPFDWAVRLIDPSVASHSVDVIL